MIPVLHQRIGGSIMGSQPERLRDRHTYAITSEMKNAKMEAHARNTPSRYMPGTGLEGSSSEEGRTTTWSVLSARSLTMRAMTASLFYAARRIASRQISYCRGCTCPRFFLRRYAIRMDAHLIHDAGTAFIRATSSRYRQSGITYTRPRSNPRSDSRTTKSASSHKDFGTG